MAEDLIWGCSLCAHGFIEVGKTLVLYPDNIKFEYLNAGPVEYDEVKMNGARETRLGLSAEREAWDSISSRGCVGHSQL
jgi:hypothetical protein